MVRRGDIPLVFHFIASTNLYLIVQILVLISIIMKLSFKFHPRDSQLCTNKVFDQLIIKSFCLRMLS